jgi:cell division protein FtsB
MDDPPPTSFSTQEAAVDNTPDNRGRSSSRKRQLSSTSADLMKPPQSRQRSLSVTRQSVKSSGPLSNPVTFKTQGESFNMSKLVQETLLKPELIKNIVPSLLNEIKAELISELKSAIRSTVAEAIEEVVNPLRQLINEHQNKIKSLENDNNQLKEHVKSSIASVEARYEKFRNVTNNTATFIADNKKLKADNVKLIHEVSQLNGNIEELEQYGRRTSLRFHNVPMVQGDLQKTDQLIVDIVNKKLKITPPLCVDDINRSHIIGTINNGKGQLICRFKNWKIKNAIYMLKKNLKNNPEKIFITEDLTKTRQFIVKELNTQKRDKKIHSFWTFDGRIFAKKDANGRKQLIKCVQDIDYLINSD